MKRLYKRLVRQVRKQVEKVGGKQKRSTRSRAMKKSKTVRKAARKSTSKKTGSRSKAKKTPTKKKAVKKRVIKKKITKKRRAKKKTTLQASPCADYIFDPVKLQAMPYQILREDGSVVGDMPKLRNDDIITMYKHMVLARIFDARCIKLQRQGRMGTYASVLGQEADQVGSAYALQKNDWLVPTFRENASCMVRGMKMKSLLQYWGGDERGHADPDAKNVLPISIPISTQDLHAVGIAMAMKYRNEKNAVLCHMGDGGTSEGDFHEALNFAGVFQAPVVFLTTNNQWAISVPRARQTRSATLAQKALAYGFPGVIVDGNDIFAVYKVISEALDRARKGKGPTLVECVTYRMGDHTTADDQKRYRSQKEVTAWKKKDPIDRLRKYMEKHKLWNAKKEQQLQDACVAQVSASVKAYEEDPLPNPKDMFKHTYATMDAHLEEQQAELIETMGDKVEKKVLEKIEGGFP